MGPMSKKTIAIQASHVAHVLFEYIRMRDIL